MDDDLLDPRLTEKRNLNTANIDTASPLEIVDLINAEDSAVPEAVRAERESIARAIEIAAGCFKRGGRLLYVGAGTSGRLGVLDAAECPPTFGSDPELVQGIIAGGPAALTRSQEGAEDAAEAGATAVDVLGVGSNDFVFGIATSSTTPYVRGALERAVRLEAQTGFLCCTEPGKAIRDLVDVCVVPLVGPEVIAGSTRMKAGTATKLVLNTITTGAMIRLGKVYENLMVDLQALSEKLIDRSQRIVMVATGCTREEALAAIDRAEGSVKLAIVMRRSGIGPDLARVYLAQADGFVRRALEKAEAVEEAEGRGGNVFAPHATAPPDAAALAAALDAARELPDRIARLVAGASDARLGARPAANKYSVKEQLEHLIDIDAVNTARVQAILKSDAATIVNRDDEEENLRTLESGARETPIEAMLERLRQSRAGLMALLGDANEEQFAKTGKHELFGPISAYQILGHLLWHDDHHESAIERLLAE